MKIIKSIEEMKDYSSELKTRGETLASIDTDSDIHEGHLSLVKVAKNNCDKVVVTLGHALTESRLPSKSYERFLHKYIKQVFPLDVKKCELHNVDAVFHPPIGVWNHRQDLVKLLKGTPACEYVDTSNTNIKRFVKKNVLNLPVLAEMVQGIGIVSPDVVMLGQKDFIQTTVLKNIIKSLQLPIKVIIVPTLRKPNKLAFSSRHRFLTDVSGEQASCIYKTLLEISEWGNYPSPREIKKYILKQVKKSGGDIGYIFICCTKTLKELDVLDREFVISVAGSFNAVEGHTSRVPVVDNIIIKPN